GYGGMNILTTLLDQVLPDDLEITVVDKNPYHSLKTEFYTIAAGTVADTDVRLNFPIDNRVKYEFGEIEEIDVKNQQIAVKQIKNTIFYDYLVIGLGCEDNHHGIEVVEKYTESVQTFSKSRYTGLAINNLKAHGKVSIVGAGLSGIEVASE